VGRQAGRTTATVTRHQLNLTAAPHLHRSFAVDVTASTGHNQTSQTVHVYAVDPSVQFYNPDQACSPSRRLPIRMAGGWLVDEPIGAGCGRTGTAGAKFDLYVDGAVAAHGQVAVMATGSCASRWPPAIISS